MTLSDFATFTTAISGLAVTASLIYLALQTHQNAKHTRALIFQGRAERISNQYLTMADPALAAAYIVGNGGTATQDEILRHQFRQLCSAFLVGWQDTFQQHEEGLLNEQFFEGFTESVTNILRTQPGLRAFFGQTLFGSHVGNREFSVFMQKLVANAEADAVKAP